MKGLTQAKLNAQDANELTRMHRVADEAMARAQLEREREAEEKDLKIYVERVAAAKRIRARRRRLGRNGFALRRMAVPSFRNPHPTRRSQP